MSLKDVKKIYMMGIGGIAMGTLATMLKEKGYEVVGSDYNVYPPMSTHLEALRVPVFKGYNTENLSDLAPDLVVIGNVIRRDNPEAQFVLEKGLPYLSMPEAIARFFLSASKSIVVGGTHGKSTSSSLLGWILDYGGLDPTVFVGAFLKNWQKSYRLGSGPYTVLEGDEYDTAFFDKGPKFLHYRPYMVIVTSIEYDHADIFPNLKFILEAFRSLVRLVPPDGYLIVNGDDPLCVSLGAECRGNVISYGSGAQADWRLLEINYSREQVRFEFLNPVSRQRETMTSRLPGRHNVVNTLAVLAAASIAGLSTERIQEALLAFDGVKRRQDMVGKCNGVLIIDDFAHHPTAVHETIAAIRLFYPGSRLIAAFEPRTNSSRRSVFQNAYTKAFDGADCVCVKHPPGMEAIPVPERLDAQKLVEDIRKRRKEAYYFDDTDSLVRFLSGYSRSGDVLLCMSNGSFDGLPQKLLCACRQHCSIE
jgi:UDP-N-acetylmuramate: L-alanyl-gamma-D-glutamyl-meso-diaminopimelate ligase